MLKSDVINRLEKIYNLAESQDDIRSMIKIAELIYKINSQQKTMCKADALSEQDLSKEQLEALIGYLSKS